MTSDQASLDMAEMGQNSPDCSEGETYDDNSYGSGILTPGLTEGFVMVTENCCRARYCPSRVAKDAPFYICLNKSSCRSLAGGHHPVLRGGHRADPGVYEGIYGPRGKLVAAQAGTRHTHANTERMAEESRASNRAQADAIGGLTSGGSAIFSTPDTQDLYSSEKDQEGEVFNAGSLEVDKDTIFLKLMSSLVNKIKKMEVGIKINNTAILQAFKENIERMTRPGILHTLTYYIEGEDGTAISSVVRNVKNTY